MRNLRLSGPASLLLAIGFLIVSASANAAFSMAFRAGDGDVTPSGQARYTVPLWTPTGIGGIEPRLALLYAADIRSPVLGTGWALGGLSTIARCNRTVAQHAVAQPVTLTMSDAFCMDGQTLRVTSGIYGQANSQYQTEIADFSLVTAQGTVGNGPAWFEVKTKEGLIYEYGNSTDSRALLPGSGTPHIWALNKIRDRDGNNLKVTYLPISGTLVPSLIQYTQTTLDSSYPYAIVFNYVPRSGPDVDSGYVAGLTYAQNQQLSTIEVRQGGPQGTVVRVHRLYYAYHSVVRRTLLTGLEECADNVGTDCKEGTTFSYYPGIAGVATSATSDGSLPTTGRILVGDINGDGRSDIVYQETLPAKRWWLRFATSTGFAPAIFAGAMGTDDVLLNDFIGSGKEDLLIPDANGNWVRLWWNGTTLSSTGTNIALDPNVVRGTNPFGNSPPPSYASADVNGDGLPDLIWAAIYNNTPSLYTRLNVTAPGGNLTFSTTMTAAYSLPLPISTFGGVYGDHPVPTSEVQRMDFNGDQRSDAFFITYTGQFSLTANAQELISLGSTFASGPMISDYGFLTAPLNFNDDACTDLGQGAHIQISACNTTAGQTIDTATNIHMLYMDWNGDGRTDILTWQSSNFAVMYSNGGSAAAPTVTAIPFATNGAYLVLDQDGDALSDLAFRNTATDAFAFHRHNGAGTPPGYLANVSPSGGGYVWQVQYKSIVLSNYASTDPTIPPATYPQAQFTAPLYVVSHITGGAGLFTKDYFYWSARRNLQGRSFQGFARRRILDSRSGMYFYEDYKDTFPHVGQVWLQRLFQSDNATLAYQHQNVWSYLTLDSNPTNARTYPFISAYVEKRFEVGGPYNGTQVATRTMGLTVDSWGTITNFNINTVENATGANPGAIYDEGYTNPTITNDTVNWCLSKPTQRQEKGSSNLPGGGLLVRTTNYVWDTVKCRLTSEVIEPGSTQWQVTKGLEYDTLGNLKKITLTPATGQGQVARSVQVDYGTTGQFPRTLTDAKGFVTQFDWDVVKGVRTAMTDPNGLQTSWTYDNFGRKTREARPDGTKTDYAYLVCGDVPSPCGSTYGSFGPRYELRTTLVDAANHVTSSESRFLDIGGLTRVIERDRMTGPRGIQYFNYDAWGRLIEQTAPFVLGDSVFTTTFTYDALSRITRVRRPMSDSNAANNDTVFGYSGLTQTRTDALGHTTTTRRDPLGRIVQMLDASNQDTDYEYDGFGNLLKIRDPGGAETIMTYNARGMRLASSDPDRGPWNFDYFPLGELKSQTDAKGKTISFTYDPLSRILSRTMPEGASGSINSTFTWGSSSAAKNIGRLESMQISGTGVTTYSETNLYDSLARLSQITYREGTTDYLVNLAYHPDHGLLSQVTYPTSTSGFRLPIQYEYQHGMLSRVFDSFNQFWVADAIDASNRVTKSTLGEVTNGVTLETLSSYDQVTGLLESSQSTYASGAPAGTSIANLAFVYDAVGNVIQRQDNQQGLTENLYYDALDRLDYSTLGAATTDYSYDTRGNLTAKTGVGTLYSYTANVAGCTYYTYPQLHAVRQITGGASTMNFCYDANGNMTNRNGTALTWFADNLPKTITKDASNSSTFEYGPNGQRWRHVYRTAGADYTHTYIGRLLEKVVGPTSTDWKHYIYANGELVAMYIRKSNGSKDRYFLTKDRLGSVSAIAHSNGTWIVRESFAAFGQRRAASTWAGAPSGTELTLMNGTTRRGFTMHEHLDSTGLIHMNGRVYDPLVARFVSADPFLQNPYDLQLLNRYSYVGNNPLRATDPTGFFGEVCPDCRIPSFPPDYPWPNIEICFVNCPVIPTGPPAHTPVTCITVRGHQLCGDGDLLFRPRQPGVPPPPPLVQGPAAPDADAVVLPTSVTLAADNVVTLPWFWNRPNTNQQISSEETKQVYTRINAPEGFGIDLEQTQKDRESDDPGTTIANVRFIPMSEKKGLLSHVYVNVVTGQIVNVADDEALIDAEQKAADAEYMRQWQEKMMRGEDPGSPIPPRLERQREELLRQLPSDSSDDDQPRL